VPKQKTVEAFRQEQKADFIRAFQNPAAYPVGVQFPTQTIRNFPVAIWKWDPKVSDQKAFIRTVEGNHTEYWARINNFEAKACRSAFLSFLETEHGVPSATIPSFLNADHLLNKAFALRHGLSYVRMALVEGEINSGYGGKIERNLTQAQASSKSQYVFDSIVLMKALHIQPPKDPDDYRERREMIASRM